MTIHDVPNVEIMLFIVFTQRTRATVTQTNRIADWLSHVDWWTCRVSDIPSEHSLHPCTSCRLIPVNTSLLRQIHLILGFYIFSHIVILLYIFRVRHSRGEMYNGHGRVSVCLSLAASHITARTYLDVSWGNCRGCPLVVHRWQICNRCTGFVAITT